MSRVSTGGSDAGDIDFTSRDDGPETDSLLVEAARLTLHEPPIALRAGTSIAGRYRLVRMLGRGAHGEVWEAQDRLDGAPVAVKVLLRSGASSPMRARREVAALRLLRVPGVVRLVDEGVDEGRTFLVMERVFGTPFPGAPAPMGVADLAGPLAALLEALARVHALGVIHRDLKPANVLVDDGGRLTILDFGLSFVDTPMLGDLTIAGQILGTPAYLAPEQITGGAVTERTDLYAVGVLAYAALTGRLPHEAPTVAEMLRARRAERASPIGVFAPDLPRDVASLVDQLLSPDPSHRCRSAREALDRLRGMVPTAEPLRALLGAAETPLDEPAMRALFAGTDRLFHLREDAARALFERTSGVPRRVADELGAWLRAGLARWDDGRIAVDRDAIERLDTRIPASLWRDLASADARTIAREAHAVALDFASAGHLGRALVPIVEALRALRRLSPPSPDTVASLLSLWVEIALDDGTPHALDRVLYELCRPGSESPRVARLEALVRAALAIDAWTPRAPSLADAVPPFDDPRLDLARHRLRVKAARRISIEREEQRIEDAARWIDVAGDDDARAALAHWRGRLAYARGRFEESAHLHALAASSATWRTHGMVARIEGASAWMEAFRFEDAAAWAEDAKALAEGCRHALFEARAEWILRSVAYRSGRVCGGPDADLVGAAALLGAPHVEALTCLNEAAIAFRAGSHAVAGALARRAYDRWTGMGHPLGPLLSGALVVACGGTLPPRAAFALADQALACTAPGVGLQALALLSIGADIALPPPAVIDALASQVPRAAWSRRMDVLSVDEARARLVRS